MADLVHNAGIRIRELETEVARLKKRLEITHAYDGAGNEIPFPAGMEDLDGIACRDETIRQQDQQIATLRAKIAALASAPPAPVGGVPAGWKLVPEDPTPAMVAATWNDPIDVKGGIESQNTRNKRVYRAMLASAPPAPSTGEGEALRAELRTVRKALEPFADAANFYEIESQTDEDVQILVRRGTGFASALTVRDFRNAQRTIRRSVPVPGDAGDLIEAVAAQLWLDTFGPDGRKDWHGCVREAEEYGPESAAAMQVYQWRARAKRFANAIRPWLTQAVAEHPSDERAAWIIRKAAARIEELDVAAASAVSRIGLTEEDIRNSVRAALVECGFGNEPIEGAVRHTTRAIIALLASSWVGCQTGAARDVLYERRRQIEVEGWTLQHDDAHHRGEMARAAGCYALLAGDYVPPITTAWPWSSEWWKPSLSRRHMLVKAAALIIAEIERLDRSSVPASGNVHLERVQSLPKYQEQHGPTATLQHSIDQREAMAAEDADGRPD